MKIFRKSRAKPLDKFGENPELPKPVKSGKIKIRKVNQPLT